MAKGKKSRKKRIEKKDDGWIFWLAIVLSIIGILAVLMLALHALKII